MVHHSDIALAETSGRVRHRARVNDGRRLVEGPELGFLRHVVAYFLATLAILAAVDPDGPARLWSVVVSVPEFAVLIAGDAALWLVAIATPALLIPGRRGRGRIGTALVVGLAGCLFHLTFLAMKTTLPDIVPFFADPALARFDAWMHGGIHPWEVTHRVLDGVPARLFDRLYTEAWMVFVFCFPMALVLIDGDAGRRRRFLLLYVLTWIGLGNLLALLTMSAGPIYHDRLTGLEVFPALDAALSRSGIAASFNGHLQQSLWSFYEAGRNTATSGISAFPSVHVAMVTVLALYLYERLPRALPLAVLLVAAYQVMSVHLGWHYAVDGYASILLVAGAWVLQRRHARRRAAA